MTCQTSLVMVLCRLEVTLLIFPLHADDCGEIQSDIPGDAAAVEEEEVRKKEAEQQQNEEEKEEADKQKKDVAQRQKSAHNKLKIKLVSARCCRSWLQPWAS